MTDEKQVRREIVETGKTLVDRRLTAGRAGNLSARLDDRSILVTATGAALGSLSEDEILRVPLDPADGGATARVTTEFTLHRAIHLATANRAVIHCHPALVNAYFAVYSDIKELTFETKIYLGSVPVIPQETPSVTDLEPVRKAFQTSNLVVLKNHGVVAAGADLKEALLLTETLDYAVRTCAVARLFKKDILDGLDRAVESDLAVGRIYDMFSRDHIQAIVDLVNKDDFIGQKGRDMDMTLQLAIRLDGHDAAYRFTFEKGRITALDSGYEAAYVISAPADVWESVFLGKLEPFVATMQGKMKLAGEMGKLSRWYVPFSRLFELFKCVRIK